MKIIVVAIAISVVALSAWIVYSKLERSRHESLAANALREAAHRAALAPYQRDLPIGTSRADVDKYLISKHVNFSGVPGREPSDAASYEVDLGEEPGESFVCDRWNVYIRLDFKSALPYDTLQEIRIEKIGHCL